MGWGGVGRGGVVHGVVGKVGWVAWLYGLGVHVLST